MNYISYEYWVFNHFFKFRVNSLSGISTYVTMIVEVSLHLQVQEDNFNVITFNIICIKEINCAMPIIEIQIKQTTEE